MVVDEVLHLYVCIVWTQFLAPLRHTQYVA